MNIIKSLTLSGFVISVLLFSNLTNLKISRKPIKHPNIILILADDMGYGDASCYNANSKIPTPNIDRLAEEGIMFTDAHAPAAACTPTRYGILTGRYAWRGKLKKWVLYPYDWSLIEENRVTLPSMLRTQGYQTALIGKWHLGWNWPLKPDAQSEIPWSLGSMNTGNQIDLSKEIAGGPLGAGFNYFYGVDVPNYPPYCFIENRKIVGKLPNIQKPNSVYGSPGMMREGWDLENILPNITQKAVDFIQDQGSRKQDEPFFLFFSLTAPHTPIKPAKEFLGTSHAGDYGDLVVQVDYSVGAIREALKKSKLDENTIIIFTSDNGSPGYAGDPITRGEDWQKIDAVTKKFGHYPNGDWRGTKADIWEGGHRIPLIAWWPHHFLKGEKNNAMICLTDLMATFAKITGATLPSNAGEDSFDFSSVLLTQNSERIIRESMITHSGDGTFAIRKGSWKLIQGQGSGGLSKVAGIEGEPVKTPGQLYNLDTDPREKNNLYAQHPEMVKELNSLLESQKTLPNSRTLTF